MLIRFAPFVALAAVVACASDRQKSADDDDGGAGSSSSAVGGASSSGSPSSSSNGGSTNCQPGGAPCQAFSECCSGVCDNQVCAGCSAEGESCASQGCCAGLDCDTATNTCASCGLEGEACTLASECCSNVCDQGTCGLPAGSCDQGNCQSCGLSSCAQAACASEFAVCNNNPDCTNLVICAGECADTACVQACMASYPNGAQDALAVQACVCQPSVCSVDCAPICS